MKGISHSCHMGQFLQDGKNACFVSFFFKVEPLCYKTWYSRVYFSIVSSKLGLVHQKITSWPSVMIFLSSFFLVVLAIFSKFWGMFRALVCPYYQRETFFDPTIISAIKFWWFFFFWFLCSTSRNGVSPGWGFIKYHHDQHQPAADPWQIHKTMNSWPV